MRKNDLIARSLLATLAGLTLLHVPAHADWNVPEPPKTLMEGAPILTETYRVYSDEPRNPFPASLKPGAEFVSKTDEEITKRLQLREDIKDRYLAPCRVGTVWRRRAKPRLFLMGGGGASGKGTLQKFLPDRADAARFGGAFVPKGIVAIDPDSLKESLPEYDLIIGVGDHRAAATVHEESSELSKQIIAEAYSHRCDILMDVTLGRADKATQMLKTAKSNGYTIHLVGATLPPEEAVSRAASRARASGRYVPTEMLLDAHMGFSRGFDTYVDLVDTVYLFDMRAASPKLIFKKPLGGPETVIDVQLFAEFQKKANLDPTAKDPAYLYPPRVIDYGEEVETLTLPNKPINLGLPYIWEYTEEIVTIRPGNAPSDD